MAQFLGHLMLVAPEPCGLVLRSRRRDRREMEQDNEVEVNDITVHFKGEGRRRVERGGRGLE